MKRSLASFALIVVVAALSGCYYDPGYSYVRPVHGSGDAYYGEASQPYYVAPAYAGGYYGDGYYSNGYYSNGYYGGGYYGCCYAPGVTIGIGGGWYRNYHGRDDGHGYYRGGYRHGDGHNYSSHGNGHERPASTGHGHYSSHSNWQSSHHH